MLINGKEVTYADKETTDQAILNLSEARAYVRSQAPYFSSTIYALRPVWVSGFDTLGVTKHLVCIIDAAWFTSLPSVKMRGSCLVHEVMHILRGMHRLDAFDDKELANVAGDIPINDDMEAAKASDGRSPMWELPEWRIVSDTFGFEKGLTLEQYYDLLKKLPKSKGGAGSGNGAGMAPGGPGQPFDVGGQRVENKIFAGGCGGVAGNSLSNQFEDQLDQQFGRSEPEVNQVVKDGIKEVQSYAQRGKGRGNLPGCLEELLEWSDEPPAVPWLQLLNHAVRQKTGQITAGRADFSIRRPAKRSYTLGIVRPGMIDQKIVVAFVRDTSGSMGGEQLQAATREACGVFQQLGIDKAWFLDADTEVAAARRVGMRDIPNLQVKGRGGTSFVAALAELEDLKPSPDLVIYFTDGDGYAPPEPPKKFEVVWCIVPSSWQRLPAPWGTVIVMSDDGEVRNAYEYEEPEDVA